MPVFIVVGPTLRNEADSRKLDKCGTVSGKTRIARTINQQITIIGDSEASSVI